MHVGQVMSFPCDTVYKTNTVLWHLLIDDTSCKKKKKGGGVSQGVKIHSNQSASNPTDTEISKPAHSVYVLFIFSTI